MLLPFDYAILTLEETQTLIDFIEKSTATPAFPKNYKRMHDMGVLEIYKSLIRFIEVSDNYKSLSEIDTDRLMYEDYD